MPKKAALFVFFKSYAKTFILLVSIFASCIPNINFARNGRGGRIVFLGKTANGEKSVWLSATTRGSFEVQARNQTVDQWNKSQRGLHVTFSPIVSNGSGDPHTLYRVVGNNLIFLDKDNQQGGIIFPPFPGLSPPGIITPPIARPPGEVTHPIVPPGEVTHPIVPPGEVTHPIVPPGEVTHPIVPPGEVTHPIVPPGEVTHPIVPPGEVTHPITPPRGEVSQQPPNNNVTQEESNTNTAGFSNTVPLTQGREFAIEPLWNTWIDGRYYNISDNRHDLDLKGHASEFTIGTDRQLNNNLVAGIMLVKTNGKSSSFDNSWQNNLSGFSFGPYFGYKIFQNWVINGTLEYGQYKNNNDISILDSTYTSHAYSASLNVIGQYDIGKLQLRPKPALYYTYFHNTAYNLNGSVNGTGFVVPIAADNFSFGVLEFAQEVSRPFSLSNGKIITVPYIELGIDYEFARPNGGQILTGDLLLANTSPWSGLARVGARTLLTKSLFIEASASYLSIGQSGLNIWESRLFVSYGF